jgi:hypothetical protein
MSGALHLMATTREALTRHGAIVSCKVHKYKRAFKTRTTMPTNKCPVCYACWLADRLETSIYQDDLEDLIKFSNTFTTVVKPSSITYTELEKDNE